jgi:cell division protease FtsH
MNKKNNWLIALYFSLTVSLLIIFSLMFGFGETFFVFDKNNDSNNIKSEIEYGKFINYLDNGWIKSIDFYDNGQTAILEAENPDLGTIPQKLRVKIPSNSTSLIVQLKKANVDIDAHAPQKNNIKVFYDTFGSLIIPTIIVAILYLFFSRSKIGTTNFRKNNGPNQLLNLKQSNSELQINPDTGISFDDMAGIDEVKEEFQEIVTFLKNPSRFTVVGATIPKGVLLVGPPGTGKTLLAKAIAGEAKVPFINMAGSEFVEMFVGVGASRVRDLFAKAKKNTPCIVFIDEIDAVGRQRGAGVGGGNDEREQTLNQLLTEMDGFEKNKGIIVIAATNRDDVLDSALLRPGRFDRQITVNPPDKNGRESILKIHSRNKKLAPDVSLEIIAQRTPGFGGADLANVLNEAAIISAREEKTVIGLNEINLAIERVIAGLEGPSIVDNKNKRLFAYHESGHAITATLIKDHDRVQTVTLIPRGQSNGLTWFVTSEDPTLVTRSQILARIVGSLAGRAAEEIIFGETELTSGASNDLFRSTDMAKQMVTKFGMAPIGPVALGNQGGGFVFVGRGIKLANEYSAPLAIKIDRQIRFIVKLCYNEAIGIMISNRISLDKIVNQLIDREILRGNSCEQLISEFSKLPENQVYETKFNLKEV